MECCGIKACPSIAPDLPDGTLHRVGRPMAAASLQEVQQGMEQNTLSLVRVLWDYMHLHMELKPARYILGFGSRNTAVAHRCAQLYLEGFGETIVFSGGLGRNTQGCWSGTEAARFADLAAADGVPREAILLEDQSTNTMENILFTRQLLRSLGEERPSVIAVHQQFMERRFLASVQQHWRELDPVITSPDTTLEGYFSDMAALGMAEKTAIEVMVGDVQRMKVYAEKGWMAPQPIPGAVWSAYEALVALGYTGQLVKE